MTFKTSTWHLALHSLIFSSQKTHLLTKKNQKKIFLKILFEITQKIDVKLPENVKTENDPWCLLPQFSQLLVGQMSKVGSVLKSSEQADFKTDLPFWIWWRFEVVIARKQTGRFFWGHPVLQQYYSITKFGSMSC